MPAAEKSVQSAIVTDVQRFSVHDGPGIRTIVFFKGCPLRCRWCHNPETQRAEPEIRFQPARCIGCGTCTQSCKRGAHVFVSHAESAENAELRGGLGHLFDRSCCVACGSCAAACPAGALERVGEERSIADLVAIALRDAPFYGRDGGITVSGGEPLAQPDALFALLVAAREAGITTCVETCGAFDPTLAPRLAALADTILFDLKDTDEARLRVNTGADLDAILRTLRALDAAGANLALRCVLIPGVNLCDAHAHGIVDIFRTLVHARSVELLPYHALGAGKAESLGREQRVYPVPTVADLDAFADVLRANSVPLRDIRYPKKTVSGIGLRRSTAMS